MVGQRKKKISITSKMPVQFILRIRHFLKNKQEGKAQAVNV